MACRKIEGLIWARALPRRPNGIPIDRPRGAKAEGIRYEKALARALPKANHGQWFEFEDSNGRGYCQTDLIFSWKGQIVVLEAKYTWRMAGHRQIEQLYRPILAKITGKPVLGVVVCKRLRPAVAYPVFGDLEEALRASGPQGPGPVWHWLGLAAPVRASSQVDCSVRASP